MWYSLELGEDGRYFFRGKDGWQATGTFGAFEVFELREFL
jgi:hypothetical protein